MKQSDKPIQLENVELVPDAMERLEGAIKHAARKPVPASPNGARQVERAKSRGLSTTLPMRSGVVNIEFDVPTTCHLSFANCQGTPYLDTDILLRTELPSGESEIDALFHPSLRTQKRVQ